ncbi:phosphomannomutase/phosphoglucomutase, partial [Pseudomonas aeruginosa]
MKLFQRTAKDGNELDDLLEPEKKPLKAASERADGKDLLPGIGASLLGVAAAGALLWFGVFGGAGEAQQRQLDAAWAEGQAGALRQTLQQLAADTRAAAA